MPRISVLMTSFNAEAFLVPAVDSILNQSCGDFELVAVDDGSTDGTKALWRSLAARDSRIRLIDLPQNIGRTPALRMAMEQAQGDLVAVMDADDLSLPDRFALQLAWLDTHPADVMVAANWSALRPEGRQVPCNLRFPDYQSVMDALSVGNPIAHSSVMFRRAAAIAVGGYPLDYVYAQDMALFLRLMSQGKVSVLPQTLVHIREHAGQMSAWASLSLLRFEEMERLLKEARHCLTPTIKAQWGGRKVFAGLQLHKAAALWRKERKGAALRACWAGFRAIACGF